MSGLSNSTPVLVEDLGLQYNQTGKISKVKRKHRFGLYKCPYCGSLFRALSSSIKNGNTKSCGCLKLKGHTTHGLSKNKYYHTWVGMIQRCTNQDKDNYKHYGGRGITVCEDWQDVRNFIAWCDLTHPNIDGYTLDRIDTNGGYSPNNCRWATRTTQNLTQRLRSTNTSGFKGIYLSKGYWIAQIRVNAKLITLGKCLNLEDAVLLRDTYIINNNLNNNLSIEDTKLGRS
mgnify:FL=1